MCRQSPRPARAPFGPVLRVDMSPCGLCENPQGWRAGSRGAVRKGGVGSAAPRARQGQGVGAPTRARPASSPRHPQERERRGSRKAWRRRRAGARDEGRPCGPGEGRGPCLI